MKTIILLLLLSLPFQANPVHENSGKTHTEEGGIGPCYGWEKADAGMHICYMNKERTLCKILIYNHGQFHESEPFVCEEGEDNEE